MKRYQQKKVFAMIVFILLVVSISSCRKDLYSGDQDAKDVLSLSEQNKLLEEARQWYNSKPEHARGTRLETSELNAHQTFIGTPEWNKTSFYKTWITHMPIMLRVPLKDYVVNCSFTKKMSPNGYREVLLRKQADGDFIMDIGEWHPDIDALPEKEKEIYPKDINRNVIIASRDYVGNSDFKGYFLIYTASNDLRYGERQENGRVISRLAKHK